jgi:sn-glycerol 3-phosphate transport system substrate-binding protein
MLRCLILTIGLLTAGWANAAWEIRVWHTMQGAAAAQLAELARRFNDAQKQYRVVLAYRPAGLQAAALASPKSGPRPHIIQVGDAGTAEILSHAAAIVPLWRLMAEAGQPFEQDYFPAVAATLSDGEGRLLALPFNASTPVLYYNRDAFRNARLDPAKPPQTWYEMPDALGALVEAGELCAFTTARPSWVLLENMSAWHDQEFATHQNGVGGDEARLAFNTRLMVRWISMLSTWSKSGYFSYSGRGNEAEARFAAGECVLLTSSSASYAELRKRAKFDLAVAQLPYYDDFDEAPQNTLFGGAALWVLAGKPKQDYRGVAEFLAYLAWPEIQAEWVSITGDLPLTQTAYEHARRQGFFTALPIYEIAVQQLRKAPTRDSQGIRLARLQKIRDIIDEELELVWKGSKTPLDALNTAVSRGNALLEQAARTHGGR